MKLTRHLFGWSADARLMDYYERVLFNHRLGTINPEDGTTFDELREERLFQACGPGLDPTHAV